METKIDEAIIKEQYDQLLKSSEIKLDDYEYITRYHIFRAGWYAYDKWFKNRYYDDGR